MAIGSSTCEIRIKKPYQSSTQTEIDEAFVVMGNNVPDFDALVLKLVTQGKRVHFVPGFFDAKHFRQGLSEFGGIPILSLGGYGLSLGEAILKRTFDIVSSIVLLIGFSSPYGYHSHPYKLYLFTRSR